MSKESLKVDVQCEHRVVDMALLQASAMIPGTGKTESTLNAVKVPGIKMLWIRGEGLLVNCKGKESLIPSTNVKIVHFAK